MSEQNLEHSVTEVNRGYWSEQYNVTNGPDKIAARRELNFCLPPNIEPVYFEDLSRDTLYQAGIGRGATVLDIGCGFPKDLGSWLAAGHLGRLIGVDPNSAQFNGLPYTAQTSPYSRGLSKRVEMGDPVRLHSFLERMHYRSDINYNAIELYEASADKLPLKDGSVDVVQWLFSTYALDKAIQETAFAENTRVLRPEGRTVVASSGADNKSGIRECEEELTVFLNDNTELSFKAPIPVNAWNASEDVEEQLLKDYDHVYVFKHHHDLVFDSLERLTKWYRSFWTLQDRYIAYAGVQKVTPTDDQFELAMMAVLGPKMAQARRMGKAIVDHLRQDMFLASNSEQHTIGAGFEQLK